MKNKIYIAIICAFSIVFAVSSGFLIKHYYDSAKQAEMYDNLIEVVETEPEDTPRADELLQRKDLYPRVSGALFTKQRYGRLDKD